MANNSLDNIVFKKKSFSNILEEIYNNQKNKEKTISALIQDLKPMVKNITDATLIVPLIKEYLEIGVKNDEQLVKIAQVVQKIFNNSKDGDGDGFNITEAERKQLMDEIEKIKEEDKK